MFVHCAKKHAKRNNLDVSAVMGNRDTDNKCTDLIKIMLGFALLILYRASSYCMVRESDTMIVCRDALWL